MTDELALYKADWMRALADAGLGAAAISKAIELADLNGLFDPIKAAIRQEDEPASYNDGYTHEALHTTHVLMETFGAHVLDTRCAAEFPDVEAAAEKAHQALFDLYQLIGSKFVDDPPTPTGLEPLPVILDPVSRSGE